MCDIDDLSYLTTSGFTLSVEERAGLEVAMLKRQNDESLPKLYFWGKIMGSKDSDYLICVGILPSYDYPTKKFFYCTTTNFQLQQLPETDAEKDGKSEAIEGMFTGNPAFPYEEAPEGGDNEEVVPEVFREEHRLAYVVKTIDHETATVPRGSYLVAPSHQVVENRGYEGLDFEAAGKLSSYFHFRKAVNMETQSALEKQGLVRSTDFLDPLSVDKPTGSWSVQFNSSKTSSSIRSLLWPGYFFFHKVNSSKYGGVYFGYGQKNKDIAFML